MIARASSTVRRPAREGIRRSGMLAFAARNERGSVLIIVLWVAFGLVSLTLYFAHSMSMELRAADNRLAALEAKQAIDGAVRYLTNLLANLEEPGRLPDRWSYKFEDVPVGESRFWLIGRDETIDVPGRVAFGLVDEGSRLNLNTATIEMLEQLPRMTPELAAAIVDWRDEDSDVSPGGAEDEAYQRLVEPYRCKNAPFESVEELRLVQGMTLEILYGEDTNLNGILDLNENDADASPPFDDQNGRLDPGIIEYLTVRTREATVTSEGTARLDLAAGSIDRDALTTLLGERFGTERANQILQALGDVTQGFTNVIDFYTRGQMTAEEFAQIEQDITVGGDSAGQGKVNVNTAPEAVLACIPGIGIENAGTIVAHRRSNVQQTPSIAWLTEILDSASLALAAPYITGQSYQYSIDVAAVGRFGRGYQRVRFVCDVSSGTPVIVSRQDLTGLGWALGREVRRDLTLAQKERR